MIADRGRKTHPERHLLVSAQKKKRHGRKKVILLFSLDCPSLAAELMSTVADADSFSDIRTSVLGSPTPTEDPLYRNPSRL